MKKSKITIKKINELTPGDWEKIEKRDPSFVAAQIMKNCNLTEKDLEKYQS